MHLETREKEREITCMVEDPPPLVPTYAIHKAWQPCPGPKHQLKVVYLENTHQLPFSLKFFVFSAYRNYFMIQIIKTEKLNLKALTVVSTNCHEISLPHQSHHMTITWPWSWALNNNSTRTYLQFIKYVTEKILPLAKT